MRYRLKFLKSALKEWKKLSPDIQNQFKTHLARRLESPHVMTTRIRGYADYYKIKLRSVGYRLVYEADDNEVTVYVICVGRRDSVYKLLNRRKGRRPS